MPTDHKAMEFVSVDTARSRRWWHGLDIMSKRRCFGTMPHPQLVVLVLLKDCLGRRPSCLVCVITRQIVAREDCNIDLNEDEEKTQKNHFFVGDKVFLKGSGRCMDAWSGPHRVTRIWSPVAVELVGDGIKQHISHVQLVPGSYVDNVLQDLNEVDDDILNVAHDTVTTEDVAMGHGRRVRRSPAYLNDYDTRGSLVSGILDAEQS